MSDAAAGRFDANLLGRLTAALAEHIGPVAPVVVAQAAEKAAEVHQLCMALASHVPTTNRTQFLKGILDLVRTDQPERKAPKAARADAARAVSGAAVRLSLEVLARAAQRLAEHIGPIAPALVDRESPGAATPAELYARLAEHIENLDARKAFLASAPRSPE